MPKLEVDAELRRTHEERRRGFTERKKGFFAKVYYWIGDNVFGWEPDWKYITKKCMIPMDGECFNFVRVAEWCKNRGINCETYYVDCLNPDEKDHIIKNGHMRLKVTEINGEVNYIDYASVGFFRIKKKWAHDIHEPNVVRPAR